MKRIIKTCLDRGVPTVSFWGLAYKNIVNRTQEELTSLYALTERIVDELLREFETHDIRFEIVGDLSLIAESTQQALQTVVERTKDSQGMTCILAIGYGGQREIVQAVKQFMDSGNPHEDLTEEVLHSYMDTGRFPNPDLIIRTGADGRLRHSGYFLYASEYSEYYFTKKLWPEFNASDLDEALRGLDVAERNFGR